MSYGVFRNAPFAVVRIRREVGTCRVVESLNRTGHKSINNSDHHRADMSESKKWKSNAR